MVIDITASSNKGRNRESDKYVSDLHYMKPLTLKEEKELCDKARNGKSKDDRDSAREQLIKANQRFVYSIARKYYTPWKDDLMDLIMEGNLGLIKAIDEFDTTKNNKLSTYAVYYIKVAITDYLKYNDGLVYKPIQKEVSGKKINDAIAALTQELEGFPTPEQVSDYLNEKEGDGFCKPGDILNYTYNSLDVNSEGDEITNLEFEFNMITSDKNQVTDIIENDARWEKVNSFLSQLDKDSRIAVEMHFGIGCETEYTDEEIGHRLGVPTQKVDKIIKKSIARMQAMEA